VSRIRWHIKFKYYGCECRTGALIVLPVCPSISQCKPLDIDEVDAQSLNCHHYLAVHGTWLSPRVSEMTYFVPSGTFFLSLLWAGVQPTLDPSTETISRSNALAQGERRGIGWCVHDVQGR